MTVVEKNGKFYVQKKDGSLGKRGFSKRGSAEKAQEWGRQHAWGKQPWDNRLSPPTGAGGSPTPAPSFGDMDTAAERRGLGIPPKRVARGEF